MAEERDPLTPPEKGRLTPDGMTPATAGYADDGSRSSDTYDARDKDPRDIERDIEHTRSEMSETIDAIGARFEPAYLKEQAKDALRSTARDAGSTMIDTIKENPLPAAIAGLSIAWLFAKGSQSDQDRYEHARYEASGYDPRYYPARPYARTGAYAGGVYAGGNYRGGQDPRGYGQGQDYRYSGGYAGGGTSDDSGQSLTDRAGDAAGAVRDRASDVAGGLAEQAQDFGHQAQDYGHRATNWLEDQMHRSPLAVGAVVLAAGALVGLAVPETQAENEWMGRQSDDLARQAKEAASEKIDQAKEVASKVAEEAKDKAKDVASTAKEEAKDLASTAKDEAQKGGLNEPPSTMSGGSSSGGSSSGGSSSGGSSSGGSSSGGSSSGGSSSGGSSSGGSSTPGPVAAGTGTWTAASGGTTGASGGTTGASGGTTGASGGTTGASGGTTGASSERTERTPG